MPEFSFDLSASKLANICLRINERNLRPLFALFDRSSTLNLNLKIEGTNRPDYGQLIIVPRLINSSITDAINFAFSKCLLAPKLQSLTLDGASWPSDKPGSDDAPKSASLYTSYPSLRSFIFQLSPKLLSQILPGSCRLRVPIRPLKP